MNFKTLLSLKPSTLLPIANPLKSHATGYEKGLTRSLSLVLSKTIAKASANFVTTSNVYKMIIACFSSAQSPPCQRGGERLW